MLVSQFRDVSGPQLYGCAFLVDRVSDADHDAEDGETWVGIVDDKGVVRTIRGERAWYTDIWQSPSRAIYLCCERTLIVGTPQADSRYQWETRALPFRAWGVWGLSDALFFAWGFDGKQQVVARIEGEQVTVLAAGGSIVAMDGCSPDLIYAVGEDGLVLRLDGDVIHRIPVHERASFNCVEVRSDASVIASTRSGQVWQGSVHGLSPLLPGYSAMNAVATWNGDVIAASDPDGLHRFDRTQWDPIATPDQPIDVYAKETLVLTGPKVLADTTDLATFRTASIDKVKATYKGMRLHGSQTLWLA